MLIAIMGDTFDNVYESKQLYAIRENLGILSDYSMIMSIEQADTVDKFIFLAQPLVKNEEGDLWTGKITEIKEGVI